MNKKTEVVNIFGINIKVTNFDDTLNHLLSYDFAVPQYICFVNVLLIVEAYRNKDIKNILNNALTSLPDGKPLELYARAKGIKNISTVSGYWLIKELLKRRNYSHFFYGTNEVTLIKIKTKIEKEFPENNIVGYKAPPYFQKFDKGIDSLIKKDFAYINTLKPDFIWVGVSSPKQNILMHRYLGELKHGLLMGVGAVFDYLADNKNLSPEWMKKLSLRWLYRIFLQPKFTWEKYLFYNTIFMLLIFKEIIINFRKFLKKIITNS